LKPFAHGIESEDGQAPTLKWAHIDIAGSMEVRLLGFFQFLFIDTEGFDLVCSSHTIPREGDDWAVCSVSNYYVCD